MAVVTTSSRISTAFTTFAGPLAAAIGGCGYLCISSNNNNNMIIMILTNDDNNNATIINLYF